MLQVLEHLSDRQAADAVRARIDWTYALGLELVDPGLHFSALAEFASGLFPARLSICCSIAGSTTSASAVSSRRAATSATFSTHVLGAVHDLHLLELVSETLRATFDDLAAVVPDWLRAIVQPVWFERYGPWIEDDRRPRSQARREALALEIGADGIQRLDVLEAPDPPPAARAQPMTQTLRDVRRGHDLGNEGRRRSAAGQRATAVTL